MPPPMLLVILGIALFATIWFVVNYNALVRLKNHIKEAWAQIDTELKRRHDLIPNLVKAVDQYASYERATLEAVTALRDQAKLATDIEERGWSVTMAATAARARPAGSGTRVLASLRSVLVVNVGRDPFGVQRVDP